MTATDEEDGLSIYDQIEIEDMSFDDAMGLYTFPCPCGDRFEILLEDLREGQDVAVCPSCSLMIRVIFEAVSLCSVSGRRGKMEC
jgi:diphthamide biosynthesis protein 3